MRFSKRMIVYAGLLFVPCVLSAEIGSSSNSKNSIDSQSEALEKVAQYVGNESSMRRSSLAQEDVQLIDVPLDSTPFLRDRITNAKAWLVRLDYSSLLQGRKNYRVSTTGRIFDILIDSATGVLLKATCDYQPLSEDEYGDMSPEYAEEQMQRAGEIYMGFPDNLPPIGMLEALEACPNSPLLAKQIEVQLLVIKRKDLEPLTRWVITLKGIPPIPIRGVRGSIEPPVYQRNHIRQIVNAETGKISYSTTFPQYRLKEEDNMFLRFKKDSLDRQ